MNPFLRFPRFSLALSLLGLILLLKPTTELQIGAETRDLLRGDQRNFSSYEELLDLLGQSSVIVVDLDLEDVFSAEGIEIVREASEAFSARAGVLDVKSLTHSWRPIRQGFSFRMVPLVPAGTSDPAQLEALREFALGSPFVRDVMVSADGGHTLLTVTYARDFSSIESKQALRVEVDEILAPFHARGIQTREVGVPLVEEEIHRTLIGDAVWFLPAGLAVVLLVLAWALRSSWAVSHALANQAVLLLVLPGVMQLAGFRVSVFTVMVFPLLASVQLTLLLHVLSAVRDAAAEGGEEPIASGVSRVFKACLFASLTTAVGLFALGASEVEQVRDFGLLASIGIVVVFLLSFGPGLALLSVMPRPSGNSVSSNGGVAAIWLASVSSRRRAIWVATLLIVVVAAIGLTRLRTDIRAVEFLGSDSPTRRAAELFDQRYGGINIVQIDIDSGSDGGADELEFLRYLDGLQQFAGSRPGVSGAYSYAQLLAVLNEIWEGGGPGTFRLPDSQFVIDGFLLMLRSYDLPMMATVIDTDHRVVTFSVRTADMPASRYLEVVGEVVEKAREDAPEGVVVSEREGLHSILEADRRILRAQVETAGLTVLAIFVMLSLLWWSPRLAMLAVTLNVLPVLAVIGVAGWLDLPINSITVMVGAIAFGIAVDDTVHVITCWRQHIDDGRSGARAMIETLRVKGRPIVATSLVLIGVFGLFSFASFPPVAHFGFLCALAFAVALAVALVVLPSILGRGEARDAL